MKGKMSNRILSVFLVAAIMASLIPANVFAEENEIPKADGTVIAAAVEEPQDVPTGDEEDKPSTENQNSEKEGEAADTDTGTDTDTGADTETGTDTGAAGGDGTVTGDGSEQSAGESQEAAVDEVIVEAKEAPQLTSETDDSLNALVALAEKTSDAAVSVEGKQITVDAGGLILLSNIAASLEGYTVYLLTLGGQNADLTGTIVIEETEYAFRGLGTEEHPFSGNIEIQGETYGAIINVPFFTYVDVSKVQLIHLPTLKIERKNEEAALLAGTISGIANGTWGSLIIQAIQAETGDDNAILPGELIGSMAENAALSLGTVTYQGASVYSASGNAGLLCNTMGANSSLSVNELTVSANVTVTANNGAAGGLVGRMETGASLTVGNAVTIGNYTITGKAAGGLIGSGTDVKLGGAKVTIDGATVNGSAAVGGLMGSYTTGGTGFASYDGSTDSYPKVNQVILNATADKACAGGLFGVLELKSDYAITNACVSSTIAGSKANYGGLIGQVKGDDSASLRALTISGTTTPTTSTTKELNSYAGAVAIVGNDGNSPVYVKIDGILNPAISGLNNLKAGQYFGGVAAYLMVASVIEISAEVAPTGCTNIVCGGGVLGNAAEGSTLCLAGTTDLSSTKFTKTDNTTGQIVGTQKNALIYAKSDWVLIRQTEAQQLDDIGSYGQVIRLGGNMGMGTPADSSGLSPNLISQNPDTHKTTYAPASFDSVTTVDQLALIAIAVQAGSAPGDITLGADISLAHTGIIGVQIGIDSAYIGTLNGSGHTLTLATGEIYGYRDVIDRPATKDTAGSGQIHGHSQVGFFSQADGTIQNLTVNGEMNLYFRGDYTAGGLVAGNTGEGTFHNVTSLVTIHCQGTNGGYVGGLVGAGTSLTISNCTGSAAIDVGNSKAYAGGLIGNYTGTALTVSDTTLSGTMTAAGAEDVRLGGLVSRIAAGSYSEVTVTLMNLTVSGQTITSDASKTCGGLLGYEWNNAKVIFGDKDTHSKGVTVKALTVTGEDGKTETRNSAVSISADAEGAGLVYTATGYWQVNHIALEQLSLTSSGGDLGILVCRGWKRDSAGAKPYLLYVEETGYRAYDIDSVEVNNSGGYFDEWVVYTCEAADTITGNGNSVISIATLSETKVEGLRAGVDPDSGSCTSYQNRTSYGKTADPNPNARYYYDLDVIRENAEPNGYVDTPGELVLWAVWRYSEEKTPSTVPEYNKKSNIEDYFLRPETMDIYGTTMDGQNATINLTGYSYYPITIDGYPLNVENITIQFANQEIEAAEALTGVSLDSMLRTTVGTPDGHTQHYLMHSGLLLDYKNSTTTQDVTLNVSNVTFRGSIGKGPDGIGSGALVCGQLGGNANAATPKYAKLDIDGLTLGGITVNADKTSHTDEAAAGYAPLLVNCVGSYSSLSAQRVSVAQYTASDAPAATSLIGRVGDESATNISLAFSNGIDLSGRKSDSIFSHATLLESFQYQASSSGYYHFNAGEACTYGWEINNTIEYEGSQLKYYDQSSDVQDGENRDFSNYLPYVCQGYDSTEKYHELEINVPSPDLTEGCGTYDDPYLIRTARQLQFAAQFINGVAPQSGWKVNKAVNKETIKADGNTHHSMYEAGKGDWNNDTMRTYLRGAYYQIQENLDLNNFPGFGSGAYPFVGVIDGNEKIVTIDASKNESGLINVSCGSVVRKLTISYTGTKKFAENLQLENNSNKVTEKSYFGGIIGTVKGGDSLIEDVTVTFSNDFSITTSDNRQCAGGFVGLIQGGGVVLRNMGSTTQNPGYTGSSSTNYVDKYIGRVLDGYAINETGNEGVTFAGKNYAIANISATGTIAWNNGTIAIGNAQQMMILTDIINSGAASGGQSYAYSGETKTRNADYSLIGKVSDEAFISAFNASRADDTKPGTDNYPYLIAKYAGKAGDFWTACKDGTKISITFPENAIIDLSAYGNGYRGIGGRYNCTANGGNLTYNTPMISAVAGKGVSLKVSNDIAEYKEDNFYANAVGGLFNVLRHEVAAIENLNVSGTVKVCAGLEEAKEETESNYLSRAPVGGIIGRDYCESNDEKTLKLSYVSLGSESENSTVYGECVTGGLIGSSGSYAATVLSNYSRNKTILSLENCSYQRVTIVGGICTGGLVGSVIPNYNSLAIYNRGITPGSSCLIRWTESKRFGTKSEIYNLFFKTSGSNGVGGLIGLSCAPFTVKGDGEASVVMEKIELHGGKSSNIGRIGGVVGFIPNQTAINCEITNIELNGLLVGNSSKYDDNTGGFIGTWYSRGTLTISESSMTSSTVQGEGNGGIVGYAGYSGTIYVKNVVLDGNTIQSRGGATSSFYSGGIGGYIVIDFYGQNILLKNTKYIYSTTNKSDRIGRCFGTGDKARLLGVTIQQTNGNALPAKDMYNLTYPSGYETNGNYVVYAGYKSSGTIESAADIAVKPSITIPGVGDLHGDTVIPTTVCNAVTDSDTYYQNLSAAKVTKEIFTNSIQSTYNANQENKLTDGTDFKVVVIDGDASVLRQYLNAATNGGFDSMRSYNSGSKIKVEIARYVKAEGANTFSVADAGTYPPTLIYQEKTGEFKATAQYDNQKDTFTLVTVTMTGYSRSDTFVLHIPVIVRRMLQVDFMATMTSGTVFNKTDAFYSETKDHALASAGESITGYLTFHYNSNSSDVNNPASYDWENYMETGGNLLGYYKKTVDTGKSALPAGTRITLIDCQNADRRYYAEVEGAGTQLELFNGGNLTFKTSDDEKFVPAALSDLLQITATEATEENKADESIIKWVQLENATGATVKAKDGYYYRLATDSDQEHLYTLKVGNSSPREDYFVVISVPNKENYRLTLYKSGMVWSDDSTASPPMEVHQVHRYDPKKANNESVSEASFNYLDNYKQTLTDNTTAENVQVLTTSAKVELPISVTSAVSFDSKNYTDTDPLYQKFVISLKKTEDGVKAGVGLPSDAVAVEKVEDGGTSTAVRENAVKLYAYYEDDLLNRHYWNGSGFVESKTPAASYAWSGSADSAEMVLPFAQKEGDGYHYIDLAGLRKVSGNQFYLAVETTLELSVASVLSNNTIPYDSASGEINNYTQVDAASVLSFTESGLSYSTLRGSTSGRTSIRKYYLNTARNAVLKLDYTNIDQLGINAREDTAAAIDAILTLDFSNMEGFVSDVGSFKTLSEADTVTFTISLKKKGASGYSDVSIDQYLSSATIPDGTVPTDYTITLTKNADGSYPYYHEKTGQFIIPISFAVNMGVKQYANYRIFAAAALWKDGVEQKSEINQAGAYITYTYAKINVNGHWNQMTG